VLAATFLTTLAIQASDKFSLQDSSILGSAGKAKDAGPCAPDMAYIPTSDGGFCIDKYEAAPGEDCAAQDPNNQFDTNKNMSNAYCAPVAEKNRIPWTNVTMHQAMDLCARVGKRLPVPGEWFRAALGTPEEVSKEKDSCALGLIGKEDADPTGVRARCVSSFGAYDMVGNVWEWVDASVIDGKYKERELPYEGYVSEADSDGIAVTTENSPNEVFHGDYFFIERSGVRGMFQGGFWNMDARAGTFAVNAANPTSFIGNAVGFRCAK
jgi:formylglycine-generating enzyme required for sulfatase activity